MCYNGATGTRKVSLTFISNRYDSRFIKVATTTHVDQITQIGNLIDFYLFQEKS